MDLATLAFLATVAGAPPGPTPQITEVSFQSPALTRFWGQPTAIHADVLVPESYDGDPKQRYPTIYVVPAFDGDYRIDARDAAQWRGRMRTLGTQFIVVKLQGMFDVNGEALHQEYADSSNDRPWGTALTSEFIPATDARFRTIPTGQGRFLFGHSSGGWSVLCLQINYPDLFAGAWALSPDPVDFHDFFGPDLTRSPPQNFYHDDSGNEYGMDRVGWRDRSTIRTSMTTERWMQRQIDTCDVVFGPREPGGKLARLFDWKTGTIDSSVAAYWEAHYDLTHLLEQHWSELGQNLNGKLHVYVGDQDTFHLDGSVHRLHDAIAHLGGNAEIAFLPGDDHWRVYNWHGDVIRYAMSEMIADLAASQ